MTVTSKSCSNITNTCVLVCSKRNWTSLSRKLRMLWRQTVSCSTPMARQTSLKGQHFLINILECNELHWLLWADWFGLHFCFPFSGLDVLTFEECSTNSHFDLTLSDFWSATVRKCLRYQPRPCLKLGRKWQLLAASAAVFLRRNACLVLSTTWVHGFIPFPSSPVYRFFLFPKVLNSGEVVNAAIFH